MVKQIILPIMWKYSVVGSLNRIWDLVIFLVALIVLGPAKLPEVARQIGGVMREVRRISSGFQDEMRAAMEDPIEAAARERGNRVVATSEAPAPAAALAD